MTRQEFATFAMALKTYYPREALLPNQPAMELWYRELEDIPYKVAEAALRKWVATNKWSPSIAEIREITTTIQYGEQLTWGEAWERALNAVRRYGSYNRQAALDSLDPLTRKCVENIGYLDLCMSENIMVERAHFQKIFEVYSKRAETDKRLPLSLVKTLELARGQDGFIGIRGLEKPKD